MGPKSIPSIGVNQKRSKPFSANMHKKRVIHDTPGQAASTHATSFKPTSMPTAANFNINKQANGTHGVISSNDSFNNAGNYSSDNNLHDRRPGTTGGNLQQ